jgi:short-subunit dehydrogenase
MKTIIITGSSSGIGNATVNLFLEKGWKVVGVSRSKSKIINSNYSEFNIDITDYQKLDVVMERIILENSKIDCLFNNAGYGYFAPVENSDFTEIKKQFETNFFAQVFIIKKFLSIFRKQGGGTIVTTTSMLGRISLPFFTFYSASKWALEGFLENLRYELFGTNISLKVIEPGTIKTNFFSDEIKTENFGDGYYKDKFQAVMTNINNKGENGADPKIVAEKVWKAVNLKNNKFRYLVDFTSYFLVFNRKSLPLNVYQFIIRNVVK